MLKKKRKANKDIFKKKAEPQVPDFTNIDYELMLINRHKSKPDDVKALYQAAYIQAQNDESIRQANHD